MPLRFIDADTEAGFDAATPTAFWPLWLPDFLRLPPLRLITILAPAITLADTAIGRRRDISISFHTPSYDSIFRCRRRAAAAAISLRQDVIFSR